MAQITSARSVQSAASDERAEVKELLLKRDRPRDIDRHIDYFGGASEPASDGVDDDVCGEAFMERPA